MKYIRGANSAFADNGVNYTSDAAGCYRIILLRSMGYEVEEIEELEPIKGIIQSSDIRKDINFTLGYASEQVINKWLIRKKYTIETDVALSKQLTEEVAFKGHSDCIGINPKTHETEVFEYKSISSVNSYLKIIHKSQYKLNNLAQLVAYMIIAGHNTGRLMYVNYIYCPEINDPKHKFPKMTPVIKYFTVCAEEDILVVDDKVSIHKPSQIVTHMLESARVITEEDVSVIKPDKSGSCFFCKLKPICDELDKGQISKDDWKTKVICMSKKTEERSDL
jgi:hypothetical protein